MAVQEVDDAGNLWFLSAANSHKNAELGQDSSVQLYFQGRRLTDMYRFGTRDTRWLTTASAYNKACFLPITYVERQSNTLAPQPNNTRLCQ